MRLALIAVCAFVIGCDGPPPPPPPIPGQQPAPAAPLPADAADGAFASPLSPADAERILATTNVFDVADPGFGPGRQVQAFNVLFEQSDALERFRRLAVNERAAGRLYALCGLLLISREEGNRRARSLSLKEGQVAIRSGDSEYETSIASAIVLILVDSVPDRLRAQRDEAYRRFNKSSA